MLSHAALQRSRVRLTQFALLIIPALAIASETAAAPLFGPYTDYGTDSNPYSVAIGDLNGDGRNDLVTANTHYSTVSVLLGNGDGTFTPRSDFSTASGGCGSPLFVAIADLDADGNQDLVMATENDQSCPPVSVLLGNGDGTFGSLASYGETGMSRSVAVADLNRDGMLDIALPVTEQPVENSAVAVLLGNGDGTLDPRTDFPTFPYGATPWSVAIRDFNADAKLDLAVTEYRVSAAVSVFLGNGDGTFGSKTDYPVGDYAVSVAAGNLNADGSPDLAVANQESHTLSLLFGNGDGTFGLKTDYAIAGGGNPSSVAIRDLDGDGKHDLAVARRANAAVVVFLGNGDGTIGVQTDYPVSGQPLGMAVGDLNGDGRPDLATANPTVNAVSVLLNISPAPPLSVEGREGAPSLKVEGIHPSPARGLFTVVFSLTGEAPAWMEVVDVAGRRVIHKEMGRLRPGHHSLRLGEAASLAAGVYTVRLTEAGRTVSRTVVVVR